MPGKNNKNVNKLFVIKDSGIEASYITNTCRISFLLTLGIIKNLKIE